jgi:flagellar motor switch protein FliN/FliY
MNAVFRNPVADTRVTKADELFKNAISQSFTALLEKAVALSPTGPHAFDFKEIKGLMPGEVIVCSINCSDGGHGKIQFVLNKETAAVLADMLLMGDGSAAFSNEDHLEPVKDFFKDVLGKFTALVGEKSGRPLGFDENKIVLIDLTPGDFAGGTWTVCKYDYELIKPGSIFVVTSNDFLDSVFPRTDAKSGTSTSSSGDDGDFDKMMRHEIGMVMDIELPITIELGRTQMLIRDIVKLAPGSIVELNKLSGEPVELYVNNKKFAKGEVVVVDENFAVRIIELISPEERFTLSRN